MIVVGQEAIGFEHATLLRVFEQVESVLPRRGSTTEVVALATVVAGLLGTHAELESGSPLLQAGQAIADHCRAARIGEVTEFAQCLVEDCAGCPERFVVSRFLYCVHPRREAIIARTLAAEKPPGK
jgi:hypothetical protein